MKLYYSPGACSLSPHIVAREAGLDVSLVKVDLKSHTVEGGGDYYAVNPKGYVPALMLDDGAVLTEGPAIVQYLADQKPGADLIPPAGSFARYKLAEWLTFINGELHKNFSPLFRGVPEEQKTAARQTIQKRFALAAELMGANPFLTGAQFTVADAYIYVMLRWAGKMGVEAPRKLLDLKARIAARPAVKTALQEEGLQ